MSTLFAHTTRTLALAVALVVSAPLAAHAQYVGGDLQLSLDQDDDVRILAGSVTLTGRIGGDLEGAAGDMTIDAAIGGDVNLLGADISITGSIGGELSIAGADLRVGSAVADDANLAGADITLTGTVQGDLAAAGASVALEDTSYVGGDARIGGRDIYLRGQIDGELEAGAREIRVSGILNGSTELRGNRVYIEEDARITGTLIVKSPVEPIISEGAVMSGGTVEFVYTEFPNDDYGNFDGPNINLDIGPPSWAVGTGIAMSAFVLGLLASLIAPRSVGNIALAFRRRPLVSGFLGLIVFAVSPVVVLTLAILLFVTIVGIPLAIVLLMLFPIVIFLGFVFGGLVIGDRIFNRREETAAIGVRMLSLFVAFAALAALGAVPVLGFVLGPVVLCIGLGAWSLAIFSKEIRQGAAPEIVS